MSDRNNLRLGMFAATGRFQLILTKKLWETVWELMYYGDVSDLTLAFSVLSIELGGTIVGKVTSHHVPHLAFSGATACCTTGDAFQACPWENIDVLRASGFGACAHNRARVPRNDMLNVRKLVPGLLLLDRMHSFFHRYSPSYYGFPIRRLSTM